MGRVIFVLGFTKDYTEIDEGDRFREGDEAGEGARQGLEAG
jgi:hypothetical protein